MVVAVKDATDLGYILYFEDPRETAMTFSSENVLVDSLLVNVHREVILRPMQCSALHMTAVQLWRVTGRAEPQSAPF